MRPCWCSPKTTWLSVERASPFWWEESSWKCYPSSFLSSELGRVTPLQLKRLVDVKNCFASKNWDLLHYYLLFQDPFFFFGPHPQYRYGWIRTIGCATLHTTKKAMSDFHFEENPQKRPTPTRCRMSNILEQSDKYQSLKIHRTCKVMIKVRSKFVVLQTWV